MHGSWKVILAATSLLTIGITGRTLQAQTGRLLTLDDTVEFFNLILGAQLTPQEKTDLVAFLRAL